jgi:hypothetical protein
VQRGGTLHRVIEPEATWKHVREGVETYYAGHWVDTTPARDAPDPAAAERTARG